MQVRHKLAHRLVCLAACACLAQCCHAAASIVATMPPQVPGWKLVAPVQVGFFACHVVSHREDVHVVGLADSVQAPIQRDSRLRAAGRKHTATCTISMIKCQVSTTATAKSGSTLQTDTAACKTHPWFAHCANTCCRHASAAHAGCAMQH